MLSNLSNPLAFGVVGVESSVAHTRRQLVEQFYRTHRVQLLASARRLNPQCPEDLVQTALEMWLRPTRNPQLTVMAFVRRMQAIVHRDGHHEYGKEKGKRKWVRKAIEVHGDIDRMFRRRHGRRTSVKGGAE